MSNKQEAIEKQLPKKNNRLNIFSKIKWKNLVFYTIIICVIAFNFIFFKKIQFMTTQQKLITEIEHNAEKEYIRQNIEIKNSIKELEEKFNAQEKLSSSEKQINNFDKQKQIYIILDASYRIKLAEIEGKFKKDYQTSLELLKTAKINLEEIKNIATNDIVNSLEKDIEKLQSIKYQGINELLNSLASILKDILTLPMHSSNDQKLQMQKGSDYENSSGIINYIINKLSNVIRISNHSERIKPLLSPKEILFMQEKLQLLFLKAEVAALKEEQELFLDTMHQINNSLDKYFFENKELVIIKQKINSLTEFQLKNEIDFTNTKNEIQNLYVAIKE